MTQCQLLTASLKLLPYQTILKEMNGLSRAEKPLITMRTLCHPRSIPLSLSLLPSPFPSLILPALSPSPLHSSLHLFAVMHTLSAPLHRALSLLSLLSKKMDCSSLSFHYSLPILASPTQARTHTHTQPLSKSLCHSDFLRLQFSPSPPAFSLSVSSKNSINQRLPALFSPHDYLWSRCSYHFSAPDKCTEYSTQPRREYFITGQMRRGEQQTRAFFLNLASPSLRAIVGLNLHITHHPPQTTTASLLSSSTWSTFFSFTASPCMIWTLLPNSPLHFYTSGFLWCLCLCLVLVPCKKKKKKELIMSLAELTGTLQEF